MEGRGKKAENGRKESGLKFWFRLCKTAKSFG